MKLLFNWFDAVLDIMGRDVAPLPYLGRFKYRNLNAIAFYISMVPFSFLALDSVVLGLFTTAGLILFYLLRVWVLKAPSVRRVNIEELVGFCYIFPTWFASCLMTGAGHSVIIWFAVLIPVAGLLLLTYYGTLILSVLNIIGVLVLHYITYQIEGQVALTLLVAQVLCLMVSLSLSIGSRRLFTTLVTNLKKARTEALQLKNQAEKASEEKSIFLSTMSHEIRTPLNGLIGLTHLLNDTSLSELQQSYVNLSLKSGDQLLSLVNNILDLSKIESGKFDIDRYPTDLSGLFDDVKNLLTPKAHEKNIQLVIQGVATDIQWQELDALRVKQVLINLASNAIKFTDEGTVTMTVKKVGSPKTEFLRFQVTDTGPGMTEDVCARLFNAYEQESATTSTHYGGTGLGLSISKQLIQLMGGTIGVESTPTKGSTFWFELPNTPCEPQINQHERQGHEEQADETLFFHRALVADDNKVNQIVFRQYLKKYFEEVVVVENGQEAVEAAQQQPFDLILLDYNMPVMSGVDACLKIRAQQQQAGTKTPIAALTASAFKEDRDKCMAAGMDAFLTKPIEPDSIRDTIKSLLGSR